MSGRSRYDETEEDRAIREEDERERAEAYYDSLRHGDPEALIAFERMYQGSALDDQKSTICLHGWPIRMCNHCKAALVAPWEKTNDVH